MNERSTPPAARPETSRLTVRLAGLAVALLPLIPAPATVPSQSAVGGESAGVVVASPPGSLVVASPGTDALVPPSPEESSVEPEPDASTPVHPVSSPGSVHVQAGAVRVIQD